MSVQKPPDVYRNHGENEHNEKRFHFPCTKIATARREFKPYRYGPLGLIRLATATLATSAKVLDLVMGALGEGARAVLRQAFRPDP
jgi:hypothetical protein